MADRPPRPEAPEAPLPTDCCGSGCAVCVLDAYADELAAYQRALEQWEAAYGSEQTTDDAPEEG